MKLLLILVLLFKFSVSSVLADEVAIEVELKSNRKIPADLKPRLIQSNPYASALMNRMLRRDDGTSSKGPLPGVPLVSMVGNRFSANVTSGTYSLVFAHPGFLRAYVSEPLSFTANMTTAAIALPEPGGFSATLIPPDDIWKVPEEELPNLESNYCITVSVSMPEICNFYARLPLKDWKLEYTDLPPGEYDLHGTGRWCDASSGPAGYVGSAKVTVTPGKVIRFKFDMSRDRHDFYRAEDKGELPQIIKGDVE